MAQSGCAKFGIGCGLIGLVLALLLAVGGWYFYDNVVKPIGGMAREFSDQQRELKSARAELAALDARFARGESDPDSPRLNGDDVERYLEVRRAVGEPLARRTRAYDDVMARLTPAAIGEKSGLRNLAGLAGGALQGMGGLVAAERDLCRAAADVLERQAMSPSELRDTIIAVEWGLLRRPEVAHMAVPAQDFKVCVEAQRALRVLEPWLAQENPKVRIRNRAALERDHQESRWMVEACREKAQNRAALSRDTLEALESRRAELESLPADGLVTLADLLEPFDPESLMPRDINLQLGGGSVNWGSGN